MDTGSTQETQEVGDSNGDNQTTAEANTTWTWTYEEASALHMSILGLIMTENRTAYAVKDDLQYQDGAVRVEIPFNTEEQPSRYMTDIDGQYGKILRGTVAVEDLRLLANDSCVESVHQPAQPQPAGGQ